MRAEVRAPLGRAVLGDGGRVEVVGDRDAREAEAVTELPARDLGREQRRAAVEGGIDRGAHHHQPHVFAGELRERDLVLSAELALRQVDPVHVEILVVISSPEAGEVLAGGRHAALRQTMRERGSQPGDLARVARVGPTLLLHDRPGPRHVHDGGEVHVHAHVAKVGRGRAALVAGELRAAVAPDLGGRVVGRAVEPLHESALLVDRYQERRVALRPRVLERPRERPQLAPRADVALEEDHPAGAAPVDPVQ